MRIPVIEEHLSRRSTVFHLAVATVTVSLPSRRSAFARLSRTDLLLVATVLVWGVNFVFLKVALDALPTAVVNALRFTVSAAVLGCVYLARTSRGEYLDPLRSAPKRLLVLGLLGSFVFPVSFLAGVDETTAGNAALIAASAPLWTALVGRYVGVDRLGTRGWIGLGVALVGSVVVVLAGAREAAAGSLLGNALVLLSAVVWGVYTALSRPVLDDVSPLALTLFGLLTALPALHLVALPAYGDVAWTAVSAPVWGAILFVGALGTGLTIVWWNGAIKSVGPARTGAYYNVVPVVALAAGALLLGEAVGPAHVVGVALILGGVLIVRRSRPAPAVPVEYDPGGSR